MFRNPKVPENALFPGAVLYGNRILISSSDFSIFPKNPMFLFAFSQGLFFSENNSETGFGQVSKFPRGTFSPILVSDKIEEVIGDKLDFVGHFVRFFLRFSTVRIKNRPRQSIPLENSQGYLFSDF